MSEPIYYLNGKYVKKSEAVISVHDLGFLRGYGVFDFIVTHGGRPFMLDDHITRLLNSAKLIDLEVPWNLKYLNNLVIKTVKKNLNGKEKTIRIVISGGTSSSSMYVLGKPTLVIIVADWQDYPKSFYDKGVKVITIDSVRDNPHAKSLNYTQGIKALAIAHRKKAVEAIYINKKKNRIYEATTSNLFLVKKGKVFTSDGDTLVGITRELVRKLVNKKYPIKVREVKISELYNADEVFLSASNKEIMPVIKVDNEKIGNGVPGSITKNIMKLYKEFVDSGKW